MAAGKRNGRIITVIWQCRTWLGIKNEYRTLIGVDESETDVKKNTEEDEDYDDA